jgi:apolipoprotein N-acyltransferase
MVGSGAMLGLGFEGIWGWVLVIFALAILFLVIHRQSWLRAWGYSFVFHLAFFSVLCEFVYVAAGWAPYLLLVLIQAAIMSLSGLLYALFAKLLFKSVHANDFDTLRPQPLGIWGFDELESLTPALLWATFYLAMEILRCSVPFGGFPFGRIGYGASWSPLVYYAIWGGPFLVSIAVLLASIFLVASRKILLALVFIGGGWLFLVNNGATASENKLLIAAVQGNMSQISLGETVDQTRIFQNQVAATRELLDQSDEQVQLIVWPENSLEYDLWNPANADIVEQLAKVCQEYSAPSLGGSQKYTVAGRYNRYALITSEGLDDIFYDKLEPVPFGEYVPFRDFFRLISPDVDRIPIDMLAGERPNRLDIPLSDGQSLQVGVLICFEITQDYLVNVINAADVDLIIAPTNNVFFGYTSEAFQQFSIAHLRAIQTHRHLLQVATTGISGEVWPNGQVAHQTGLYVSGGFITEIPID